MASAPDWKDQIKKILKVNGNDKCADCGEEEATWAVHNLGVFVCIKCSGVHRQLGVHVSKVKSTEYDKWTQDQLDYVNMRGNDRVNPLLEANLPKFVMRPNESPNDAVRFTFIQNKYANRRYSAINVDITDSNNFKNDSNNSNDDNTDNNNSNTSEQKEGNNVNNDKNDKNDNKYISDDTDVNNCEMPMKVCIFEFLHETKKSKLYFQLLTNYLYYFRYSHDSYDFEHYDVCSVDATINNGSSHTDEPCVEIRDVNKNQVIFVVRSVLSSNSNATDQNKVDQLLIFVETLKKAKLYYSSAESNEQKFDHEPGQPKKQFSVSDLNDGSCTVLGYANKKGGGARNWRKRWWILDNGILYYFKDDFRNNKKAKGIGSPQGDIGLLKADVVWDHNKHRTGKDNALLICTHKRTYFIQPTQQNAKSFYEAVESCCDHMWNRRVINFSKIQTQ